MFKHRIFLRTFLLLTFTKNEAKGCIEKRCFVFKECFCCKHVCEKSLSNLFLPYRPPKKACSILIEISIDFVYSHLKSVQNLYLF